MASTTVISQFERVALRILIGEHEYVLPCSCGWSSSYHTVTKGTTRVRSKDWRVFNNCFPKRVHAIPFTQTINYRQRKEQHVLLFVLAMLPTRGFALLFMITLPLCMAEVVSSAISCKLERHCYSASPYSDPDCQSYKSSCCECISVIRSPHVLRLDDSAVRAGPVPHCRCTIRLRFFQ